MASSFFGLNIAASGLRASNAALNTTANNIANADTEGYSRQKVVQQAANAIRTFTTYGCSGAGVETIAIERIRDEFYDMKFRENESIYGNYSEKQYYMKMIEDYFNDDGKTGFTSVFTNLKVTLQDVLKNAGSTTTKQEFISSGAKLTEYFNNLAGNLQNLQKDVNAEIKVKVDQINSISTEILSLNKQITVIELTGTTANELRDQRDELIDQLSKVVDVEVSETPIYDVNDPTRETGAHRYMVKIAGGQVLVDAAIRHELTCVARPATNTLNQSDITGLFEIYWDNGDRFNTTNGKLSGELKGLLELRDGNNGENFQGTIREVDTTNNTVTVDVTAEWLTDLTKCNLSDMGTISLAYKEYKYTSWTYNVEVDANGDKKYSYTFQLAKGTDPETGETAPTIREGIENKEAETGAAIKYQGIPYYMEQMNEWMRLFAQAFNNIMETGMTDEGNPGTLLFTYTDERTGDQGKLQTQKELFGKEELAVGNYSIKCTDDTYFRITGANTSVLKALVSNADLLATKKKENATDGESQYSNITSIITMLNDKSQMSFRGSTSGEFLTCLLGDVSLNANNANTFSKNYEAMSNSLQNQRLSISGVDADEEAMSLVQYENSYKLASKMMSTFSEIYDQLILRTGV